MGASQNTRKNEIIRKGKQQSEEKVKKPIYKKSWFYVIIAIVVIGIIGSGGSKDDASKTDNGNKADTSIFTESPETTTEAVESSAVGVEPTEEQVDDERKALQEELNEKYGIGEPSKFVRGDNTGNWRIVKIASCRYTNL